MFAETTADKERVIVGLMAENERLRAWIEKIANVNTYPPNHEGRLAKEALKEIQG